LHFRFDRVLALNGSQAQGALDERALRGVVGLLAMGAFASSAAMRVCDAMLPRLVEEFDSTVAACAAVNTGFAIAYGLLQVVIGPLGDRLGKFRVITTAMMCAALASIACALAPTLHGLVAARVVAGGMGGAIIPVAFAWIGDQVPYASRQSVLARIMSGGIMGVICGQLIGGICVDTVGWRWAFVVLAVLFAGAGILMRASAAARLPSVATLSAADSRPLAVLRQYLVIARPAWSRVILLSVMIEALLMHGALSFVPTALHHQFGMPLWKAAAVSAVVGVGGFVYTLGARRLIDTLGERRLALLGGGLVCLGLMLIGVATHPWVSVLGCLCLGLGFYAFHNTLQVHGTQLSAQQRGMGVALFALSLFVGQSVGVTLVSFAVELTGFSGVFISASLAFAALTIVFVRALAGHLAARAASAESPAS
jgi:predicted MFS family arabinose efflux permease